MIRNPVKYSLLALSLISLFNILATVPRLGSGIPLGIDSTSHLNKIFFIDAISYLSGLTNVRVSRFIGLTFLGSIPRCLFYAYLGRLIADYNVPTLIVLSATMLTALAIFKLKRKSSIKSESSS